VKADLDSAVTIAYFRVQFTLMRKEYGKSLGYTFFSTGELIPMGLKCILTESQVKI
jgi:hypothetical protein